MAHQQDIAMQERFKAECYLTYFNCDGNTNVYAFTTCDKTIQLNIDGNVIAFAPGNLSRTEINHGSGEQADKVTVSFAIDATLMTMIVDQRVAKGLSLKIFSVYAQTEETTYTSEDYWVEFWGEAVQSVRHENTFDIVFEGWNGKLQQKIPKVLFSRTHQQPLYRECVFKLNREDFTFAATILEISTDRFTIVIDMTGSTHHIVDAFSAGIVKFTTYPLEITVNRDKITGSDDTFRTIILMEKVPAGISAGEAIEISYGCDQSFNNSNGFKKFANWSNFTGIPYVRIRDAGSQILG